MNAEGAQLRVEKGYVLPVADIHAQRLATRWFWLSVLALAGAGLFSVLLVAARTPLIGEHLPFVDLFRTALVIHVNLSVLVWILAFAGILWSLSARPGFYALNLAIFVGVSVGAAVLTTGGLVPDAQPVTSNYIPVLDHPWFLSGLVLFGFGMGVQVLTTMSITRPVGARVTPGGVMAFGVNTAAISVVVALVAFVASWATMPALQDAHGYYEMLFWGGGHVLQYTYLLLMMVAWLWLTSAAGIHVPMSERVVLVLFVAGLVSVFIAPVIYYAYDVADPRFRTMFTWLMSFGGSLATLPLGAAVFYGLVMRRDEVDHRAQCASSAIFWSVLLFGAGGVIGFMIRGSDVTIPAHYHGCIVGVTLALMGVGYDLLPRLGYPLVNFSLARWQLRIYAVGQFLHILGLVWSGGYGVERKVAGAEQLLDSVGRVAGMGLMGFGGLASAVGVFLFIYVAVRALRERPGRKTV